MEFGKVNQQVNSMRTEESTLGTIEHCSTLTIFVK